MTPGERASQNGQVPAPLELFGPETRAAFFALHDDIRRAESDRELIFFMQRFQQAHQAYRQIFALIEGEVLLKLREFRDESDRELADRSSGISRLDPEGR